MSLLIAGYPYVKEAYFKTFDSYPGEVHFLLPKTWKAKGGKLTFKPPEGHNIYRATAWFYHSHYPIIGGTLKGWMPLFPLYLFKIRGLKAVFTPTEPILLSTLYQGVWSKLFGKKHVIFSWENVDYGIKLKGFRGWVQKLVIRLNLYFCDGVICGNKKAVEIIAKFKIPSSEFRVQIIPLSGIDVDFFKKTDVPKRFKNIDFGGNIVFSFAGAIGRRKGIHLIIEAMPEVLKKIPSSRFIIAGSGESEDDLRLKMKSLRLEEIIIFVPWLDRNGLKELLSVSDVFLYPSISFGGWEEQFGYSMAEASSMKVPIISTYSGSIEDVVIDGKTGILTDSDSVPSLAETMLKLGQDESLRNELGQAGRKYIEENFSYEIIADKFNNFFKSLQ